MGDIGPARRRFEVLPAPVRGRGRSTGRRPDRAIRTAGEPPGRDLERGPAADDRPPRTSTPRAERSWTTSAAREPLVGEIVGLRTFRVDDTGLLLPLFSNERLVRRRRTPRSARRRPATARRRTTGARRATASAASTPTAPPRPRAQNRQTRYVQAVVSCWGSVRRRHPGRPGRARPHRRAVAAPGGAGWLRSGSRAATRRPGSTPTPTPCSPSTRSARCPATSRRGRASRAAARRSRCGLAVAARARRCCRSARCTAHARALGRAGSRRPAVAAVRRVARCSAPASPGTSPAARAARRAWWPGWWRRCSGCPAGCCGCPCCAALVVGVGGYLLAAAAAATSRSRAAPRERTFCGVRP